MVRTRRFHCRSPGSIPSWGSNIPQAMRSGQKKKKRQKEEKSHLYSRDALPKQWHICCPLSCPQNWKVPQVNNHLLNLNTWCCTESLHHSQCHLGGPRCRVSLNHWPSQKPLGRRQCLPRESGGRALGSCFSPFLLVSYLPFEVLCSEVLGPAYQASPWRNHPSSSWARSPPSISSSPALGQNASAVSLPR